MDPKLLKIYIDLLNLIDYLERQSKAMDELLEDILNKSDEVR